MPTAKGKPRFCQSGQGPRRLPRDHMTCLDFSRRVGLPISWRGSGEWGHSCHPSPDAKPLSPFRSPLAQRSPRLRHGFRPLKHAQPRPRHPSDSIPSLSLLYSPPSTPLIGSTTSYADILVLGTSLGRGPFKLRVIKAARLFRHALLIYVEGSSSLLGIWIPRQRK
jgi:hypothetical protein